MSGPSVVQEVALAPKEPEQDVATGLALVVERLAIRSDVDVAKLEKIIELQERVLAHQARTAFEAAFAEMQGELPAIDERGQILVGGQVRSKYAKYEDIQAAIRPVLKRHGFALRHREEDLPDGKLRIIGILSHRDGHREEDKFDCPPDASGGKSNIQAIGSTRSYGMRYTTISLLNIETRGMDTDGQRQESSEPAEVPAGFDVWFAMMATTAEAGWKPLSKAWNDARPEFRDHTLRHHKVAWEGLRTKAQQVKR